MARDPAGPGNPQRLLTASNDALIRRAVQAGFFYPILMALLIVMTQWRATHMGLAGVLLAVTVLASSIRFVYLQRLLRAPASYTARHPRGLTPVLLLPTAAFASFAAASLAVFGLASMTTVMAVLAMLGIAAGGTSSLAMSRRAHLAFLVTLIAPFATMAAASGTTAGLTIVLMLVLNLVFLSREGRAAHSAFVGLFDKSLALEEAVAVLEAQRSQLVVANSSMKLVLDNVAQGLCMVDPNGCIDAHSSRAFENWFGAAPPGTRFGAHLGNPDLAAWFDLGLQSIVDDLLPTDVAVAQLPRTLARGSQTFSLAYTVILQEGRFAGILVVVDDITTRLATEANEREQRELVKLFQLLARDPEGLALFRSSADALVGELGDPDMARCDQLRALHTLKGNAAVMGIGTMATLCHALEDEMADTSAALEADQYARLVGAWQQTEKRLASILDDRDMMIELSTEEYDQLLAMIEAGVRHDALARFVRDLRLESVPRQFERMAAQAQRIAQDLGRDVRVEVDVPPLRLDAKDWRELWMACIHLMRNSLDHGIEDGSTRVARGKQLAGQLVLSARRENGDVVVTVADDGQGIDWARVRDKARELGLPTETDEALRRALFSDGLSTRDTVTEVSGRGVGLGAVAHQAQRMGGVIEVASTQGKGTAFTIRVPCRDERVTLQLAANGA